MCCTGSNNSGVKNEKVKDYQIGDKLELKGGTYEIKLKDDKKVAIKIK